MPGPRRVAADLRLSPDGVLLVQHRFVGWASASVRILRPFSWETKTRGLAVDEIAVATDEPTSLVIGPYAAADAFALNDDDRAPFDFPEGDDHDGVLYATRGHQPDAESRYQDAAGWFTVAGVTVDGVSRACAVALECSTTQVVDLLLDEDGLLLTLRMPAQTARPGSIDEVEHGPGLLMHEVAGSHDAAGAALRMLVSDHLPQRSRREPPPVIADTWGWGEDVQPERVHAFFAAAAGLGVEVVTIDKGWERSVGDWHARDEFSDGIRGLAALAHGHGMRLGLWVAPGNADPVSPVARAHPEWLAQWGGRHQVVSFRSHSLCLGHRPAADFVLDALDRLVRDGVDWLLHDFESISRCDSALHDHPAGMGEHAAVLGWYRILGELRRRHRALRIENCWNGGRVLDVQMLAHHDTTIGDDWCATSPNLVAKVGLGFALPSGWCSAYMRDESELTTRQQVAAHLVGGPWVLMGDLATWGVGRREEVAQGIALYKHWRLPSADGHVQAAHITGSSGAVEAVTLRHLDGTQVAGILVRGEPRPDGDGPAPADVHWTSLSGSDDVARWHPDVEGPATVREEFSGSQWRMDASALSAGIPFPTAHGTGFAFRVTPLRD